MFCLDSSHAGPEFPQTTTQQSQIRDDSTSPVNTSNIQNVGFSLLPSSNEEAVVLATTVQSVLSIGTSSISLHQIQSQESLQGGLPAAKPTNIDVETPIPVTSFSNETPTETSPTEPSRSTSFDTFTTDTSLLYSTTSSTAKTTTYFEDLHTLSKTEASNTYGNRL